MSAYFGWLQVALLVVAAAVLIGAACGALLSKRWLSALQFVAPGGRFVLLSALALLPALFGAAALFVSFTPSLLDVVGLVADHCTAHGGHHFHLCFVHGHPPAVSPALLGLATVVVLWLAVRWAEELTRVQRVRVWGHKLLRLARFDAAIGSWTVPGERPFAVAVGILRPQVCVSDGMRELLSKRQFDAVIAHEKAHARRRDSLVKLVVRLGAYLHFPSVRRALIDALELSCEQACDEAAASEVGDRVTVAEAILVVERAFGPARPPAGTLAFGAQSLELRVRGMLEESWRRPAWRGFAIGTAAAATALLGSYNRLHHGVETVLSWVL